MSCCSADLPDCPRDYLGLLGKTKPRGLRMLIHVVSVKSNDTHRSTRANLVHGEKGTQGAVSVGTFRGGGGG